MDDLASKIAALLDAAGVTPGAERAPSTKTLLGLIALCDARYQRREVEAEAPELHRCPTCNADGKRTSRCYHGPEGSQIPNAEAAPVASKPVLGEWQAPSSRCPAWARFAANGGAAITAYDEFWIVWAPDSARELASGTATDLEAAKRDADEAARQWYTLPAEEAAPVTPPPVATTPDRDTEEAIKIAARCLGITMEAAREARHGSIAGTSVRDAAAALGRAREEGRAEGRKEAVAPSPARSTPPGGVAFAFADAPEPAKTITRDAAVDVFPRAPRDDAEREAARNGGPAPACMARRDGEPYGCSRGADHAGDHVASDSQYVLARWPAAPSPAAPRGDLAVPALDIGRDPGERATAERFDDGSVQIRESGSSVALSPAAYRTLVATVPLVPRAEVDAVIAEIDKAADRGDWIRTEAALGSARDLIRRLAGIGGEA